MIAILEAKRAGLLRAGHLTRNLLSGVIVGVVALPLAMAFAIASGAKPEQGLYTAIVAGICVSVFGGTRLQIAGPTGAFIVILADITAKYGIGGLQVATLMAGIILVLLGLARLGNIIKFIPDPVIVGFTAGIGVIIFVSQWRDFFGLAAPHGQHFHEKLISLVGSLPDLHGPTTGLACLSLAVLVIAPRVVKRIPAPLIAMVVATLAQAVFKFDGVATIGSAFGGIPQSLPSFALPDLSASTLVTLVGPAFTIAMLGAIESLLSAVVADGMAGTRHDSNQELIGQGLANIAAPLFGGFAATGAIARTATNIRNGGTSPIAGIVHSAVLVLIVLFLAPLAADIPLCALAAILFVVAYNMSELHHFSAMVRRAPRYDVAVLVITFFLTVFTDLVVAVNVGVILATLTFMQRMTTAVEVRRHSEEGLVEELGDEMEGALPGDVMVYSIDGPFFFGAAETFERAVSQIHQDPRALVIRLMRVPFMDITGLNTLKEMVRQFTHRGVHVVLCGANARVRRKLQRAGITGGAGKTRLYADLKTALKHIPADTGAGYRSGTLAPARS